MRITGFALAIALLGFTAQADALVLVKGALGSDVDNYVGSINDGIPSSPANEKTYITTLIAQAAGSGDKKIGSETYNREGSPAALATPAVGTFLTKDDTGVNEVNLTNFTGYVLGKYDAKKAGSLVWYLSGFTGKLELPTDYNGHGLSHYSLFGTADDIIPEPTSMALMGLGGLLAGFGVRRRKQKAQELVS